jgi:hypothetical protein
MTEIEHWINDAAVSLKIEVETLAKDAAVEFVTSARARFVHGNPRVWWLAWALPCAQYDASEVHLSAVMPATEGNVFLVPELDDGSDLPVYIVPVSEIERLLNDCPFFEYYVIEQKQGWLVAETEHGIFFVCWSRTVNEIQDDAARPVAL